MNDPKKKRYLYLMLSFAGAISLSILLYFILDRMRGIGKALDSVIRILSPFIYGGVVAYLVRPVCNAYESFLTRHLPGRLKKAAPMAAVAGSLLTLLLLVYALGAMVLPRVYESLVALGKSIPSRLDSFITWAENTFGENEYMNGLFEFLNTSYDKIYQETKAWIRETLMPQISTLVTSVSSSVFEVLRILYDLVIGLIVAVYLLYARKRLARQGTLIVHSVFSEKWARLVLEEARVVDSMFGGFIDGKIVDSLIIGVLCYLGCWILRIPNTLLISVFVGVTNIIPFFGPLIGAVPATLLILIENPLKAVWFVIFVVILQQMDGNVIGPRILGNRTGLSGFWVMFAIIFFGGTWGLPGMIIGVPLFAVIYDLVRKLVKFGLRKKGKLELWEQYAAEYPNVNMPAQEDKPEQWSWAAVKRWFLELPERLTKACRAAFARWARLWAAVKKGAGTLWGFLKKLPARCRGLLRRLTARIDRRK